MTRLAAVNQMLLAAGEAIVSDLENQSGVDTSIAEYLLDEYTDDFQLRGLANNTYTKTPFHFRTYFRTYFRANCCCWQFRHHPVHHCLICYRYVIFPMDSQRCGQ